MQPIPEIAAAAINGSRDGPRERGACGAQRIISGRDAARPRPPRAARRRALGCRLRHPGAGQPAPPPSAPAAPDAARPRRGDRGRRPGGAVDRVRHRARGLGARRQWLRRHLPGPRRARDGDRHRWRRAGAARRAACGRRSSSATPGRRSRSVRTIATTRATFALPAGTHFLRLEVVNGRVRGRADRRHLAVAGARS